MKRVKNWHVLAMATVGLWLGLHVLNVSLTDAQPRCDVEKLAAVVDEATTLTEAEPGWFPAQHCRVGYAAAGTDTGHESIQPLDWSLGDVRELLEIGGGCNLIGD